MVPDFGRRKVRPRNFPATKMLGADGETEGFGGGGTAQGEVFCHFVGIVEFVGDWGGFGVGRGSGFGVLGVRSVDKGKSFFECCRHVGPFGCA